MEEEAHQSPDSLERLVFFSDAVFAIAITLLVLPLADAKLSQANLTRDLLALWPQLLSFGLSFLVVGNYWLAHQRMFRHVVRTDAVLLWLTLVFLLCIAFLPFPTAVLGSHGDSTPGVVLYAAAMSLTGLTSVATWVYASRGRRLVAADVPERMLRHLSLRGLAVPAAFLPSIAVAFVSPPAAWVLWLLAFPLAGAAARWA